MPEVYCNDSGCLWWKELEEKYIVKLGKGYVPFDDSGFTGKCTREEIGIQPGIVRSNIAKHKVVRCFTRSDKKYDGHRDFTKMMPVSLNEDQVDEYNRDKDRLLFNVPDNYPGE